MAAVAIVAVACTGGGDTTSTTNLGATTSTTLSSAGSTTTTEPLPSTIPGTASDSLSPEVVALIRGQVAELIAATEEIRGLPFLETPTVAILDAAEFTARVSALISEDLDEEETAADARLLALLGMLDPGLDLYSFLIDLYTEQVAGFYDGDTRELVVPASPDGFTALQKITVVHELVHALTDQHFEFNSEYELRTDSGNGDDASALLALVEGDATYFQLLYLQELSPIEAVQAAAEALSIDSTILDAAPPWLAADLTFPYEQGLTFVGSLVSNGGIAGVDKGYLDPPQTTEQVLDPASYLRGEPPVDLPGLSLSLSGWEVHDEGSWGEWGLRLLLMDTLSPGVNTQTAAGWGNDQFVAFARGDDIAFAMHYEGDTVADAEEVADGLIALARGAMGAGAPAESGGGLLFSDPYVFIDRVEDELFFIASTDAAAGADLRTHLGL
jgi:hypothetical protein